MELKLKNTENGVKVDVNVSELLSISEFNEVIDKLVTTLKERYATQITDNDRVTETYQGYNTISKSVMSLNVLHIKSTGTYILLDSMGLNQLAKFNEADWNKLLTGETWITHKHFPGRLYIAKSTEDLKRHVLKYLGFYE
jgi:hypothetical protein